MIGNTKSKNNMKQKAPLQSCKGACSVSKKSNYKFRHAGRLLRNGAEFRILGGKMYEGTSTEQKAKNAKSGLDSMSKPLLQAIRQHNTLLPPFTQRRLNSVCLIYMACFSPLYRQSEIRCETCSSWSRCPLTSTDIFYIIETDKFEFVG